MSQPFYSHRSNWDAFFRRLEAGAMCVAEPEGGLDLSGLLLDELTYVPKPGAAEAAPIFIEEAKSFAERFDMNMDIFKSENCIEVNLYADFISFSGEQLHCFMQLAEKSDHMEVFTPEGKLTISLELETHYAYHNGNLIEF